MDGHCGFGRLCRAWAPTALWLRSHRLAILNAIQHRPLHSDLRSLHPPRNYRSLRSPAKPPSCSLLAQALAAEHFKDSSNRMMIVITCCIIYCHVCRWVSCLIENVDVYAIANRKFIEASSIQLLFKDADFLTCYIYIENIQGTLLAKILYSPSHSITTRLPQPFHWCHLSEKKGGPRIIFAPLPCSGALFSLARPLSFSGGVKWLKNETSSNCIPKPACL